MAFDPLDPDRLLIYVTGSSRTLFSVKVNSASPSFLQATAIGTTGLAGAVLAFGQDGQLYLGAGSSLYQINQTTAAPALIGSTGVGFNDFATLPIPTAEVDLQITATDGLASVTPNSPITYTVTVTNSSSSDLQGIGVTDLVPTAISNVSWSAVLNGTGGFPTVGDQSGSGNTIDVNVNLNAGASVTYTTTGTVSSSTADGTIISNTATVTPPTVGDQSGSGNTIDVNVNLNAGASVTYTTTGTVSSSTADGTIISNTATVTPPDGINDSNSANNSSTDTTTFDGPPIATVNPLITNDSQPALTGTINDPTATVVVNVSGTNYTTTNNGDGTWTLADNAIATALADGTYEVVATATDPASNIATDVTTNELTVDTAPPTVTVNSLITSDSQPALTGTVNDPTATVINRECQWHQLHHYQQQ